MPGKFIRRCPRCPTYQRDPKVRCRWCSRWDRYLCPTCELELADDLEAFDGDLLAVQKQDDLRAEVFVLIQRLKEQRKKPGAAPRLGTGL